VPAVLLSLLSGYSAALDGMQNAARQRVVVAWHDGVTIWLRFLIAVALVAVLGRSSAAAMLGYAVASALVLASQGLFFRSKILSFRPDTEYATRDAMLSWERRMQSYAWPYSTWGLFTWLQMNSDRWGLQVFRTT